MQYNFVEFFKNIDLYALIDAVVLVVALALVSCFFIYPASSACTGWDIRAYPLPMTTADDTFSTPPCIRCPILYHSAPTHRITFTLQRRPQP